MREFSSTIYMNSFYLTVEYLEATKAMEQHFLNLTLILEGAIEKVKYHCSIYTKKDN